MALLLENTQPKIEVVVLDVDEELGTVLVDALSLRLVGVSVESFGASDPARGESASPYAYVRIRGPLDDDTYPISIIISDGRAYERQVVAPEAMAGRILASELALLLRSIEEGTLRADRDDAIIPAHENEATPPNEPHPAEAPEHDTDPALFTALELGLRLSPGGLLGIAPTQNIGESGAGTGSAGLELRWPGGPALSANLRIGARRFAPYTLVRVRIGLGGGYVLRRGSFEMPAVLLLGIEPWGIRARGRDTSIHPVAGTAKQAPLLGFVARVDPGVRVSLAGPSALLMRLGPFIELAGSAVFSDGVGVPRVRDTTTSAIVARLGGLELAMGLSVHLWLALGGPRGEPTATP